MKQTLQLFIVVLCSFCVDEPWAHQKLDADMSYIAPASWQVVKDYTILLLMSDCINTIVQGVHYTLPYSVSTYTQYYNMS